MTMITIDHIRNKLPSKENALNGSRISFAPCRPHIVGEVRIVSLEFCRSLSEQNNYGVDATINGAHENAAQNKTDDQTQEENHPIGTVNEIACQLDNECSRARETSHNDADQEKCVANEVIGNDGLPTSVLEKCDDVSSGLKIGVTIKSNINVRPFVEVFNNTLDTGQNAFSNARQGASITLGSRLVRQLSQSLNDGNDQ
mmetsp:Transcript_15248/g.25849  ORF Transcript_15248/g.25849 Transcript_15248/m.25849 type:complete len:200 (+) Transcript_15248:264-863(+)